MNILEYYACSTNSNYVARMFWITNDDVMLYKIVHHNTILLECSSPQSLFSFEMMSAGCKNEYLLAMS